MINTNLIGTINAIQVALPHLTEGASIIATGSTAALMEPAKKDNPGNDPGGIAYVFSKRALSAVRPRPRHRPGAARHPGQRGAPDQLQHPHAAERADVPLVPSGSGEPDPRGRRAGLHVPAGDAGAVGRAGRHQQRGAVPRLRRGRYVTGTQLRVDAGGYLKWYDYHAELELATTEVTDQKETIVKVSGRRTALPGPHAVRDDRAGGRSSSTTSTVTRRRSPRTGPRRPGGAGREAAHSCPEQAIVIEASRVATPSAPTTFEYRERTRRDCRRRRARRRPQEEHVPLRPAHPRVPRAVRARSPRRCRPSARWRGPTSTTGTGSPPGSKEVFELARCPVISNDHDLHGERRGYKGISIPRPERATVVRGGILEMDAPEHRDLPQRAQPVPVPRGGQAVGNRSSTRSIRACLDEKIESGRIDFVDDLANIVPAVLTLAMLGIPLKNWTIYSEPAHAAVYTRRALARCPARRRDAPRRWASTCSPT